MNFGVSRFRRLLPVACLSLAAANGADLVDSLIAGHLLGETALGAIELFWPCVELFYFLSVTLAGGTSILFAEAQGRFNTVRAARVFSGGLVLAAATGLVSAALMAAGGRPFADFFGVGEETMRFFLDYWRWYLPQAFLVPVYVVVSTLVCADGDTSVATASAVAEFAVNVVASFFLCRAMGVGGCALGTVVGTLAGLAVCGVHFFRRSNSLRITLRISPRDLRGVFWTDLPSSVTVLYTAVVYVVMNKVLVARAGDAALAALATVMVANGLFQFVTGVANAAQPIVGLYLGEENYRAVRGVMRDAIAWALRLGGVFSVLMALFPGVPARLVGVDDPTCLSLSVAAVRIVGFSYVFFGLGSLAISHCLFIGRRVASLALVTLQELVFPLGASLVGLALGGLTGFWAGYALSPALALGAFFLALAHFRPQGVDFYLLPPDSARVLSWNVPADAASACATAEAIHKALEADGKSLKTAVRVDLLVEDAMMSIRDRNPGRKVDVEITLDLREDVKVVFRDNGEVLATFADSGAGDWLRAQTIGAVLRTAVGRSSAMANGFNRSEFRFES